MALYSAIDRQSGSAINKITSLPNHKHGFIVTIIADFLGASVLIGATKFNTLISSVLREDWYTY